MSAFIFFYVNPPFSSRRCGATDQGKVPGQPRKHAVVQGFFREKLRWAGKNDGWPHFGELCANKLCAPVRCRCRIMHLSAIYLTCHSMHNYVQ